MTTERMIKKYMGRIRENTKEVKVGSESVFVYTCDICMKPIIGRTLSEVCLNGARHLMSHQKRLTGL